MLVLPQALTQSEASACLVALGQGLRAESDSKVVLDASALHHFDSAALAVLLEVRRQCLAMGKQLSIHGLPTRLGDLATLYGVGELLGATSSQLGTELVP